MGSSVFSVVGKVGTSHHHHRFAPHEPTDPPEHRQKNIHRTAAAGSSSLFQTSPLCSFSFQPSKAQLIVRSFVIDSCTGATLLYTAATGWCCYLLQPTTTMDSASKEEEDFMKNKLAMRTSCDNCGRKKRKCDGGTPCRCVCLFFCVSCESSETHDTYVLLPCAFKSRKIAH